MKFFIHNNCFELFLSVNFSILRNSQLDSDVCRLPYTWNAIWSINPKKGKEISIVSYSARENHTDKLNIEAIGTSRKIAGLQAFWVFVFSSLVYCFWQSRVKGELIYGLKEQWIDKWMDELMYGLIKETLMGQ